MHYVVVWTTKLLCGSIPPVHSGWTMPINLLPDYLTVENNAIAWGALRWGLALAALSCSVRPNEKTS